MFLHAHATSPSNRLAQSKEGREKGKEKGKSWVPCACGATCSQSKHHNFMVLSLKMTIVYEDGFIFCGNLNHQNFVHMSGDAPPTYGAESSEWVFFLSFFFFFFGKKNSGTRRVRKWWFFPDLGYSLNV